MGIIVLNTPEYFQNQKERFARKISIARAEVEALEYNPYLQNLATERKNLANQTKSLEHQLAVCLRTITGAINFINLKQELVVCLEEIGASGQSMPLRFVKQLTDILKRIRRCAGWQRTRIHVSPQHCFRFHRKVGDDLLGKIEKKYQEIWLAKTNAEVERQALEEKIAQIGNRIDQINTYYIEANSEVMQRLADLQEREKSICQNIARIQKERAGTKKEIEAPALPNPGEAEQSGTNIRKAARKEVFAAVSQTEDNPHKEPVWTFFVSNDLGKNWQPLSASPNEFATRLTSILEAIDYQGLDPKLVAERVIILGKLTVQQRQTMEEVSYGPFAGWKKVKIAKHRIFLGIDEQNHQIRFVFNQRKEAYEEH